MDGKLSLNASELKSLLQSHHQYRILADLTVCQTVIVFIGEMETVLYCPSAKLGRQFGGTVVAEGCVKSPSVCCMLLILHHSSKLLFSSSQHTLVPPPLDRYCHNHWCQDLEQLCVAVTGSYVPLSLVIITQNLSFYCLFLSGRTSKLQSVCICFELQSPSSFILFFCGSYYKFLLPLPLFLICTIPLWEMGAISFGPFIILIHPINFHIFLFVF